MYVYPWLIIYDKGDGWSTGSLAPPSSYRGSMCAECPRRLSADPSQAPPVALPKRQEPVEKRNSYSPSSTQGSKLCLSAFPHVFFLHVLCFGLFWIGFRYKHRCQHIFWLVWLLKDVYTSMDACCLMFGEFSASPFKVFCSGRRGIRWVEDVVSWLMKPVPRWWVGGHRRCKHCTFQSKTLQA